MACGGGDDDGRRLGDSIVGTWQRGWGPGDVVIDGDTDLEPESFVYDQFVFRSDGAYNGMVRKGTFSSYDTEGEIIYEGDYQCDNNNLKLQYTDEVEQSVPFWLRWLSLLIPQSVSATKRNNIT